MATQVSHASGMDKKPCGTQIRDIFQILVLGLLVLLLVTYKGSAGLNKIRQTRASGVLHLPGPPQGNLLTESSVSRNAVAYLKIVWPALVFGILISTAARTSLSHTRLQVLDRGGLRGQLAAALAGAPLMLCSCCVAPIFPAAYQHTRRAAPALALILASPSLNPAAMALSFTLFPLRIAATRVVMALTLVLVGPALAATITPQRLAISSSSSSSGHESDTWRDLLLSYWKSLTYVSLRTVPLIIVGIWASMWLAGRFPLHEAHNSAGHFLSITIISLIALLMTLPSLFEIPVALSILAAGGPGGVAAAVLFAGPAINLASLLVIARNSSWKLAFVVAVLVWVIAVTGGLMLG